MLAMAAQVGAAPLRILERLDFGALSLIAGSAAVGRVDGRVAHAQPAQHVDFNIARVTALRQRQSAPARGQAVARATTASCAIISKWKGRRCDRSFRSTTPEPQPKCGSAPGVSIS